MTKTNNKGFSLVELIIVVAIMAILIGVLAPQYIKYVEKSRVASDEQLAEQCYTAVQSALADEDYYSAIAATNTVVLNTTGITVTGGTATTGLQGAFAEYFGDITGKKLKSKKYTSFTITLTAAGTGWKAKMVSATSGGATT